VINLALDKRKFPLGDRVPGDFGSGVFDGAAKGGV
jgi:hypothetical protein